MSSWEKLSAYLCRAPLKGLAGSGPAVAAVWRISVWQEHVIDAAMVSGVYCAGWAFLM